MKGSDCVLKVGVLGLNHKTASLAFREEIAKGAGILIGEKARFFPHPTVLLSTCNRTEIYFNAEDLAQAHTELLLFLRGAIAGAFEYRLYSYFNLDCFLHLCRVASGLDSAILVETEIQRQVKAAYLRATASGKLPACMHFIFQKALHIGKSFRSAGTLKTAVSLPHLIWELVHSFYPNPMQQKFCFVGYSEMNRALIAYFQKRGLMSLTLCTKSSAQMHQGYAVVDRSALQHWDVFDCIICASQSDSYLIQGSSTKRHLIFDLSVPRNVDPCITREPNTLLYNMEQLTALIQEKQQAQLDALSSSENLIAAHARKLAHGYFKRRRERSDQGLTLQLPVNCL